jgi:hypothetical protein
MMSPEVIAERRAINRQERTARFCPCCLSDQHVKSPAVLMPFVSHRALGWRPVQIDDSWGLKTIQNGHAYSLCNSVQCMNCGALFLDIRFSDSEMGNLYNDYRGEDYIRLREHYEPGYSARDRQIKAGISYMDLVENFLRPHVTLPVRVLDWGGDTGRNTPFSAAAKTFHIYDISRVPPVDGASFVDLLEMEHQDYDLIVCSNVLEHVPHPIEFLHLIRQYMNDRTLLYLEVPFEKFMIRNQNNINIADGKKHWHEHINFVTNNSLIKLCEIVGLNIIEIICSPITDAPDDANIFQMACKRT